MKYKELGNTNIKVSEICLGTMTWGCQNTQAEAFQQLNYAIEKGINFIDTAELYPIPPKEESHGKTEIMIGNWLAENKNRKNIILASKVTGPGIFVKYIRGGPRLNRIQIKEALHASLKRLQTDYIDLYQIHWPERKTNYFSQLGYLHLPLQEQDAIPILETLETVSELVKEGKIRNIGVSNETPWGLHEYLKLSEKNNLERIASIQNPYSLLNRSFEVGIAEMAIREKVGLLAYSPLGFGVLSGKYRNNQKPQGARLTLYERQYGRYTNEESKKATELYLQLADKHNLHPAQMALAFVNTRPFVTSNIIGATSIEQLKINLESVNITLSKEVLQGIEEIQKKHTYPAP